MPIQDGDTLKSYFNRGDVPTVSNYIDLIDTIIAGGGGPSDLYVPFGKKILFSDATGEWDTNLYRGGAHELKTDDSFIVSDKLYLGSFQDVNLYRGWENTLVTDDQIYAALGITSALNITLSNAGGKIYFEDGAGFGDTNLYRSQANMLKTDDSFSVGSILYVAGVAAFYGDVHISQEGIGIYFYSNGGAADTNLYRKAANILKTDDTMVASSLGVGVDVPVYPVDIYRAEPGYAAYTEYFGINQLFEIDPATSAPNSFYTALRIQAKQKSGNTQPVSITQGVAVSVEVPTGSPQTHAMVASVAAYGPSALTKGMWGSVANYGTNTSAFYGGQFDVTNWAISGYQGIAPLIRGLRTRVQNTSQEGSPAGAAITLGQVVYASIETLGVINKVSTIETGVGFQYDLINGAYSNITNSYGIRITTPVNSAGSGAITNHYGIYIENQVVVGTTINWALYVAGGKTNLHDDLHLGHNFYLDNDWGYIQIGPDVDLYRNDTNLLMTDDDFTVGGTLRTNILSNYSGSNITISPTGDITLDPAGNDVLPLNSYDINLGAINKKYLMLHAAELWVETLVAQNTIATIGGRILVGPTTTLTSDLFDMQTQLCLNPGFEIGGTGGYDVFANWVEYIGDGSVEKDSVNPHGGGISCKIVMGAGLAGERVRQDFTFIPGYGYTLTFWTRGDGTNDGLYCVYDNVHADFLIPWTYTGVTGTSWTKVVVTFVPIGGSAGHEIHLGAKYVSGATVWFDDVQLTSDEIYVKHNQMVIGDIAYLEANGFVEWIKILSGPYGTGPYHYYVQRNLDDTGANYWFAGDALFNTGQAGKGGFIDIYSMWSIAGSARIGPTIVGYARWGNDYNSYVENWAIGNLNGLYGYGSDTPGVALGWYGGGEPHITLDTANGLRIRFGKLTGGYATVGQWDTTGAITVGEIDTGLSNILISSGSLKFRTNTTINMELDTNGIITVGPVGSGLSNIYITSGTLEFRTNTTINMLLDTNGIITVGSVGSGLSNIHITSGTLEFRTNTTTNMVLNTSGEITIGAVSSGLSNIFITSGSLKFRTNTTVNMELDTTGLITVGETSTGKSYITISGTTGIRMIYHDPASSGISKIAIETDGDIFIGTDVSNPVLTSIAIFTVAQTYNYESVGVGDLLIGDNTTSKANMMWDASTSRLQFRSGSTVKSYIDTDGAFVIIAPSSYTRTNALIFTTVDGTDTGGFYGYNASGQHGLQIDIPSIAGQFSFFNLIARNVSSDTSLYPSISFQAYRSTTLVASIDIQGLNTTPTIYISAPKVNIGATGTTVGGEINMTVIPDNGTQYHAYFKQTASNYLTFLVPYGSAGGKIVIGNVALTSDGSGNGRIEFLDANHSIRAVAGQGVYIDTYNVTDPVFIEQTTGLMKLAYGLVLTLLAGGGKRALYVDNNGNVVI